MQSEFDDRKETLVEHWVLGFVTGLVLLALGLFLLLQPARTTAFLIQLLAIYLIVGGLINIVSGVIGSAERRLRTVVLGVIGLAAGLIVIGEPLISGLLTTVVLIFMLAIALLITGLIHIFGGRRSVAGGGRDWSGRSLVQGLIEVVVALLLAGSPLSSAGLIALILGFVAGIGGILLIIISWSLRSPEG